MASIIESLLDNSKSLCGGRLSGGGCPAAGPEAPPYHRAWAARWGFDGRVTGSIPRVGRESLNPRVAGVCWE